MPKREFEDQEERQNKPEPQTQSKGKVVKSRSADESVGESVGRSRYDIGGGNSKKQATPKKDDKLEPRQGMTRQEAGRLGGKATARNHGNDYYQNLGKRGAEARWNKVDDQEQS